MDNLLQFKAKYANVAIMKNEWMSLEAILVMITILICNPGILLAAYLSSGGPADIMSLIGTYFICLIVSIPLIFIPPLMAIEVVILYCVAGVFRQFLKLARRHN